MINIQKHIGQPIISLESKKIIGYIKDFVIKNNRITRFLAFCDEQDIEFMFSTNCVLNLGDDAVVIKNECDLILQEDVKNNCILGLPIYDQQGKILGYVKDLELEDNFKIKSLLYKNTKVAFSEIDEIGKSLILLKGKYKFKKKKMFASKLNYIVNIQNSEIKMPQNIPIITQNETKTPQIPTKTIANISGLIGKTITKNIEYKGKTILKAGTQITQKVVDLALLSGTIKDIFLNVI